ncbi:MAG: hypothetical protein HY958_14180 [Bacteroidia bacterium]|nr:hypothetical protein [Bacteroidia bacterium]
MRRMKFYVNIICICFFSGYTYSQTQGVSINETGAAVHNSAMLDVSSTAKGLLVPRMTTAQRDAINGGTIAAGLIIFNTSTNCFNFYNGSAWIELCYCSTPATPVAGNNGPVCIGESLNLTASAISGATYSWTGPNGFTSSQQNPTVSTSATTAMDGTYSVVAMVNGCSSSAGTTTVQVNPTAPVAVSISASPSNTICSGTSVTFTATPSNGGTTPVYQWQVNSSNVGTNSSTYSSSSLVNGDAVTCILTSNSGCATGNPATSNTITMTVNTMSTAPTGINATVNPICSGSSTTLSVTGGSLGTGATWHWYSGSCGGTSAGTGTGITVSPTSTITYYVRAEGTCNTTTCASQIITVNPALPVSVTIVASEDTICTGTSVTFTATPVNGGTTPSFQWQLNSGNVGTNSSTYTNASLSNSDVITCILTSNATCATGNPATSNSITMSVATGIPSAPVATAGTNIGNIQFTANWNAVTGATTYYLDVATDAGFTSFVSGYNNLNVGNVTSHLVTGLSMSTTYYYQVRASNACGTSGNSNTITVTTTASACGSLITLTDVRDGQVYNIIGIGTQCWMAQNLNYGTMIPDGHTNSTNNGVVEKYCYSDVAANCTSYGGLYQWAEAMNYVPSVSTAPGPAGICPSGWHIPTDSECKTLEVFLGMCTGAGAGCVDATGWRGTDQGTQLKVGGVSGFECMLVGRRQNDGTYFYLNTDGSFQCATEQNFAFFWMRTVSLGQNGVHRLSWDKTQGYPVRCVKN